MIYFLNNYCKAFWKMYFCVVNVIYMYAIFHFSAYWLLHFSSVLGYSYHFLRALRNDRRWGKFAAARPVGNAKKQIDQSRTERTEFKCTCIVRISTASQPFRDLKVFYWSNLAFMYFTEKWILIVSGALVRVAVLLWLVTRKFGRWRWIFLTISCIICKLRFKLGLV